MLLKEYQDGVMKTWNITNSERDQKINAVLGLAGEIGEFVELHKKNFFHGVPTDHEKILSELGDIAYYLAISAHMWGFSLEEVCQFNADKLAKRYPAGFAKGGGVR
jgi:NTP pyrophosphatase (non-canonical NTP hydrolase)